MSAADLFGIGGATPGARLASLRDGTADLVIKPMTALTVEGITGTARSAEGSLVLVVGLSFLMDGCRSAVRLAA